MQQLNEFLLRADYRPIFHMCNAAIVLTICLVIAVLMLHTLYVLGRHTPLYKSRQPVGGWNKRFYPASVFMIILLLILMWLVEAWQRAIAP